VYCIDGNGKQFAKVFRRRDTNTSNGESEKRDEQIQAHKDGVHLNKSGIGPIKELKVAETKPQSKGIYLAVEENLDGQVSYIQKTCNMSKAATRQASQKYKTIRDDLKKAKSRLNEIQSIYQSDETKEHAVRFQLEDANREKSEAEKNLKLGKEILERVEKVGIKKEAWLVKKANQNVLGIRDERKKK